MRNIDVIKNQLRHSTIVEINSSDDRLTRRAMEELVQENIIYISLGKFVYQRIELCSKEMIDRYYWMLVKTIKKVVRKLRAIEKYLSKEQKDYIYNGGLFDEEQ